MAISSENNKSFLLFVLVTCFCTAGANHTECTNCFRNPVVYLTCLSTHLCNTSVELKVHSDLCLPVGFKLSLTAAASCSCDTP